MKEFIRFFIKCFDFCWEVKSYWQNLRKSWNTGNKFSQMRNIIRSMLVQINKLLIILSENDEFSEISRRLFTEVWIKRNIKELFDLNSFDLAPCFSCFLINSYKKTINVAIFSVLFLPWSILHLLFFTVQKTIKNNSKKLDF